MGPMGKMMLTVESARETRGIGLTEAEAFAESVVFLVCRGCWGRAWARQVATCGPGLDGYFLPFLVVSCRSAHLGCEISMCELLEGGSGFLENG